MEKKNGPEKSIWFTYAWDDNVDRDVDFAAQELGRDGLEVKLDRWAIEVRPRGGTWVPFLAAIPVDEKNRVSPRLHHGPAKRNPLEEGILCTNLSNSRSVPSDDGRWWIESAGNEATPTQSYYILCKELPSLLTFGVDGGSPQYQVTF
jgi:hypothetical protein